MHGLALHPACTFTSVMLEGILSKPQHGNWGAHSQSRSGLVLYTLVFPAIEEDGDDGGGGASKQ
ncbi:hypothetical protein EYF80_010346 [Liparis tanakae]|uniref:Uncharacterized protein n=1 Tax=Liparis tanakae TaxID=230148 RepID=A0A4Z2IND2_9TELE|nr:hypothetical protein EYF80_010346 [Liparis tanakae]